MTKHFIEQGLYNPITVANRPLVDTLLAAGFRFGGYYPRTEQRPGAAAYEHPENYAQAITVYIYDTGNWVYQDIDHCSTATQREMPVRNHDDLNRLMAGTLGIEYLRRSKLRALEKALKCTTP